MEGGAACVPALRGACNAVRTRAAAIPAGELPPTRPTRSVFDADLKWLDSVDEKILAYQIRQIPSEILNASEESLRALILRQLRKPNKTNADRDKIDLLLVQYFVMCASEDLVHKEVTLDDVARVLRPVLAEADPTPLEWCEPLEQILEKAKRCQSLRDMMEDGLLEQGRMLKDAAGCMFYDPAALVAFCRFNFLLRRAFIRMLHTDLSAIRAAINALEAKGVKSVDCRGAGFSAAEATTQLRQYCENWRQPFQKDYTQSSVHRAFEQLLALRADLEEALGHKRSPAKPVFGGATAVPAEEDTTAMMATTPVVSSRKIPAPVPAAPNPETLTAADSPAAKANTAAAPSHEASKPSADIPASPTGAAEAEKCLEAIWEQLIAAPPSRGRSMSTVVLQDTKVLLILGSRRIRGRRRPGIGGSAPRRGGARVAGRGKRQAQTFWRRGRTGFRTRAGADRSVLLPGPRRAIQAGEEDGSRRESGDQHEAVALVHRRSGKTSALSRAKEQVKL